MLLDLIILAISLAALLYAADGLIDNVVIAARGLAISPMVVGLTVVAVGTSLPEVMASGAASLKGHPEIALGNVVGSNICNIGLILGLPALFFPIVCKQVVVKREGMMMLGLTFLLWIIGGVFGEINREIGILFCLGFGYFIYSVFRGSKNSASDEENEAPRENLDYRKLGAKAVALLVLLLVSSEFLISSTISLAQDLGVSEAVIAISIIALGTSLPELSVSIAAAKKNQGDILVGNVLGSNITNILLVLGLSGAIAPIPFSKTMLLLDFSALAVLSMLMIFFLSQENRGITKQRGIVLCALYASVIVRCVVFTS